MRQARVERSDRWPMRGKRRALLPPPVAPLILYAVLIFTLVWLRVEIID